MNSILSDLNIALAVTNIKIETGLFSGLPPKKYIVLTPLPDEFADYADNKPQIDIQEVRISLFSKENYIADTNRIVKILFENDFIITERRYVGYDNMTGYHNYAVDVQRFYGMED
ncbi:hypothetical protein FACS1894120_6850 [Clostridia bacterium]|nr:hypothetical protein FACS1894120_6850 [Clostridia bacterium]